VGGRLWPRPLIGIPVAILYYFVLDHFIQGLTGAGTGP